MCKPTNFEDLHDEHEPIQELDDDDLFLESLEHIVMLDDTLDKFFAGIAFIRASMTRLLRQDKLEAETANRLKKNLETMTEAVNELRIIFENEASSLYSGISSILFLPLKKTCKRLKFWSATGPARALSI